MVSAEYVSASASSTLHPVKQARLGKLNSPMKEVSIRSTY